MLRTCSMIRSRSVSSRLEIKKCLGIGAPAMARGKRSSRSIQWLSTRQPECSRDFAKRDGRAELMRACAQVPQAPVTASPQLRRARELLTTLPLNRQEFIQHIQKMHTADPVQGPLNLHWCFSALARVLPPGTGREYFQGVAQTALREGLGMRKVQKALEGIDVWDEVHGRPPKQLPRYHSEPTLHNHTHTL